MKSFIKVNATIKNDEVEDMTVEMSGTFVHLQLMLCHIISAFKDRGLPDELIRSIVTLGLMQDEVKKAKDKSDLDKIFRKIIEKELD